MKTKTGKAKKADNPVRDVSSSDPWECPHCHCVLSSAEVEGPHCPMCEKPLHTHVDQEGEVFTPSDSLDQVTNGAGDQVSFGVDPLILRAIDEGLADLRSSWLVDLSGLSAGVAICTTFHKLEQLQTLRG